MTVINWQVNLQRVLNGTPVSVVEFVLGAGCIMHEKRSAENAKIERPNALKGWEPLRGLDERMTGD